MLSLNIAGRLIDFDEPKVMGIINVTPDSFYSESRTPDEASVLLRRAASMVEQGAAILDIGACSTRPGFSPVPADEEMRRLDFALTTLAPLRDSNPDLIISIDTFRADVARHKPAEVIDPRRLRRQLLRAVWLDAARVQRSAALAVGREISFRIPLPPLRNSFFCRAPLPSSRPWCR